MSYKVKLNIFEGPFDLLVYLIEHSRMSIYDIQVSEITDQYLSCIEEMKANDIAVAQDFMVLAAELVELKSKMLLPRNEDPEDPCGEEDPRNELVRHILEYKQFKEMAGFLAEQEELMLHIHSKPREDISVYEENPEELLLADREQFARAFRAFLFKKQKLEEMKKTYERIERQKMSVETKISQMHRLMNGKKTSFSKLLGEDTGIFNRVITFMALLEMLKEHDVTAEQKKLYGDISITPLKAKAKENDK